MTQNAALVTGSSRGIGFAAAYELAKAGYNIALNARPGGSELEAAAEKIAALGVKVSLAPFDVREIGDHDAILARIEDEIGPLTTLVNNAGIGVMSRGDPLDVVEESYDRCMDVNSKGLFFLTQAFAKRLLSRERDPETYYSIVNVTSCNAVASAEPRIEYCASKAAAASISRTWAVRLGRENIAVFDVQPGLIETEMTTPVIDSYKKRAADGLCLFPRVGQPEELGRVICSLATGMVPYTTGQAISVDGGMLLPRF